MIRRLTLLFVVFAFLFAVPVSAEEWGPLQFLVGSWTGEGDGGPGKGSGGFSFKEDLQHKVLVRRNFAQYPAQNGKPAFRHDDLMVVFRDEQKKIRAVYFDSEGHTIQYTVEAAENACVFVSDGGRDSMRYRLTYTPNGQAALKLKFEIAQPGKDFAVYLEAAARRDPKQE